MTSILNVGKTIGQTIGQTVAGLILLPCYLVVFLGMGIVDVKKNIDNYYKKQELLHINPDHCVTYYSLNKHSDSLKPCIF